MEIESRQEKDWEKIKKKKIESKKKMKNQRDLGNEESNGSEEKEKIVAARSYCRAY